MNAVQVPRARPFEPGALRPAEAEELLEREHRVLPAGERHQLRLPQRVVEKALKFFVFSTTPAFGVHAEHGLENGATEMDGAAPNRLKPERRARARPPLSFS